MKPQHYMDEFLMHRVELKVIKSLSYVITNMLLSVPNAPCGVESSYYWLHELKDCPVPNAPCGVERVISFCPLVSSRQFLMHRVELKDLRVKYGVDASYICS